MPESPSARTIETNRNAVSQSGITAADATPASSTRERVGRTIPAAHSSARGLKWRNDYSRRLVVSDSIIIFVTVIVVQLLWLGVEPVVTISPGQEFDRIPYVVVSVAIALAWTWSLSLGDTRDYRLVGSGFEEYRSLLRASVLTAGVVAIIAYLLRADLARGYVVIAFPLGTLLLLLSRWFWRQWLMRQRRRGRMLARVLVVGSPSTVPEIADDIVRSPDFGYQVVGATFLAEAPAEAATLESSGAPIYPDDRPIAARMDAIGADTVVISGSDVSSREWLRKVGWNLDPVRHYLIVAPGLTDVGGPRLHTRPVSGLPLMHVDSPKLSRAGLVAKRAVDIMGSAVGIVLLIPMWVTVAILIKASDGGPVLFKQERVGLNGSRFRMWKFRSMRVDAERVLEQLRREQAADAGNGVLFKMKNDPRITRLGRVMRRYSIDELPQLFNVLTGSMSLVGPRPPLEREVVKYEEHVHRRFFVKPGITGLWQVSGRSDLTWDQSVRVDLYYVENWSLSTDALVLARTVRAVFERDGAY